MGQEQCEHNYSTIVEYELVCFNSSGDRQLCPGISEIIQPKKVMCSRCCNVINIVLN